MVKLASAWRFCCKLTLDVTEGRRNDAPHEANEPERWLNPRCAVRERLVLVGRLSLSVSQQSVFLMFFFHLALALW